MSLAILIPACASSGLAFLMMYSAYQLNKQGDNIQPWRTSFPLWNQSVVPCPALPVASWPAYWFLKRQVRWSGIPISLRIFQFIVIHIVKGFGIVNEAEIHVFLELSCFFHDPEDVGNLISGSSAFSKTSLNIRKFTDHVLLKPGLENLSITLLACEMSASVLAWRIPGTGEPGGLPSMGSHRVGHDWSDLAAAVAGSAKKQESFRKTSISALLAMPKPLTMWITINWKILKVMGKPDYVTCLLRNLYAG